MHESRRRPPAPDRSSLDQTIPDSQERALDRRHSLEEQQRAFPRTSIPSPHLFRRRPPA